MRTESESKHLEMLVTLDIAVTFLFYKSIGLQGVGNKIIWSFTSVGWERMDWGNKKTQPWESI
jgi:hypothetical protein